MKVETFLHIFLILCEFTDTTSETLFVHYLQNDIFVGQFQYFVHFPLPKQYMNGNKQRGSLVIHHNKIHMDIKLVNIKHSLSIKGMVLIKLNPTLDF